MRSDRHLCFDGVWAGPDLAARRLVMAALLYYEFATNIMPDRAYDELGAFVRDHFDDVGPSMQFCISREWLREDDGLGTGEMWTASGSEFKYTQRVFYAALAWARHCDLFIENPREWNMVDFDMETGIEYDVSRG